MFQRTLDLKQYTESFFLFGPRQVGKTYLIKNTLTADIYIDLLSQKEFLRYARDASLLSKEVAALKKNKGLIIIDEIQRLPELLNEIHLILESQTPAAFILTGSSARKLRQKGVNLLGGRALTLHLHPLTYEEWGGLSNLEDAMHFGSMPPVVLKKNLSEKNRLLKSYVETYLKEEIQQESLTRNIPAFARFLELAAFENGNILNFQNIAREVGVHSKTIKEYFQILEDTLLGFFLNPYTKSHRSRLVAHPKFYLFDRGVTAALRGELSRDLTPGTPPYGRAFEHWVMLEIRRLLDYYEKEAKMAFFRTSDGAEVDLVLEFADQVWAIEIKSSSKPSSSDLGGLKSFIKDHKFKRALCVCQTPRPFKADNIEFVPWKAFLDELKTV
jgi:predicted AAA+ superfamily ATPase